MMKRRAILSLLAAGLTVGAAPALAAGVVERSLPYVLFLFAPNDANEPAMAQYAILQNGQREIQGVNIVTILVVGDAPARVPPDGHEETAASLRKRYHVDNGAFRLVLVGTNGFEKTRWSEPVQAQEIVSHTNELPKPKDESSGRR